MIKNIIKKFLLSISLGVCIGFGIFISYAVNNLSEPLIPGSTLTQSWFNDLRLRVVNIVSTSSGGNVGIGMTPTQKFEVAGNIKATSFIGNVTGNATSATNATNAASVPWTGVTGRPTNISSFANDSGYLTNVVDNRVNVTGDNITGNFNVSGNVGIGTTTPSQKLQVNGNIRAGIGTYGNIILDDDESPNGIKYIHANSNNIGFLSGGGSWLSRWDNAGNMVNTAGISAVGNITANGGLSIGYGGTLPPVGGAIVAGNVGIGTASPTQKLEVNGNVKATSFQGDGSALTGISGTPAGAIMAFYLGSCPTGWLLANGTSGTPDLRGAFIRGMGGDANGRDIARALGNYQVDEIKSHSHTFNAYSTFASGIGYSKAGSSPDIPDTYTTNNYGGTETRPKNVALIYCMKQ